MGITARISNKVVLWSSRNQAASRLVDAAGMFILKNIKKNYALGVRRAAYEIADRIEVGRKVIASTQGDFFYEDTGEIIFEQPEMAYTMHLCGLQGLTVNQKMPGSQLYDTLFKDVDVNGAMELDYLEEDKQSAWEPESYTVANKFILEKNDEYFRWKFNLLAATVFWGGLCLLPVFGSLLWPNANDLSASDQFNILSTAIAAVTVHELGHVWSAAKRGYKVSEVSLGMGLPLFSFKIGSIDYYLKALLIAAVVKIPGLNKLGKGLDRCTDQELKDARDIFSAGMRVNKYCMLTGISAVFLDVVMGEPLANNPVLSWIDLFSVMNAVLLVTNIIRIKTRFFVTDGWARAAIGKELKMRKSEKI